MNAALVLARHSLRRSRTLLAIVLAVFAGFQVMLVVAASEFYRTGTFANLAALVPPFVRQVFGDSLIVFMSFSGIVAFGYFHPMIVAALAGFVIAIATEPAGEMEIRFLDLVLSRPLRRAAVIGRSVLLLVLLPAVVIGAMMLATSLSLHGLAPREAPAPSGRLILSLGGNLWALLVCIGGVTLAVASGARRRSTAAGAVGLAVLSLFLLDYLARIWKPAASFAWLSPFHYYDAMSMITGRPLPASHLETLVLCGFAGIAAAFVLFARRDL